MIVGDVSFEKFWPDSAKRANPLRTIACCARGSIDPCCAPQDSIDLDNPANYATLSELLVELKIILLVNHINVLNAACR